jgi:hypothetical protein
MIGTTRNPRAGTPAALGLAAAALLAAACGGGRSGDGNNNNNDNGVTDAGLDSTVDTGTPDAWTYDCPATQPDGHFCLRGQVRHIVDDSPVTLPAAATVQRLIPAPGGNRPTELQAETIVQPDGRFIFPSVEKHIRQDVPDDLCSIWDDYCWPYRYDHFDLVIATDASGYHVPRNRYGIALNDLSIYDPSDYIFGLYLVANDTYDAWAAYWPGYYDPPYPFPCCELDPFSFDDVRMVVPVCYEYFRDPPPTLYPGGWVDFRPWQSGSQVRMCEVTLDPDRLTYNGMCQGGGGYNDMGLLFYDPALVPTMRYGFNCTGNGHPSRPDPGAFATFDSTDGFADGHIVVVHGLADYYQTN